MGLALRICLILLVSVIPAAAGVTELPAVAEQPVLIGVLSFRPIDQTLQQWAPIAEYLSRSIPGHVFRVVPMNYPDLDRTVKDGRFDFVFTNPEHFVLLRNQISLAPIVTVMPLIDGHPVNSFGGVIVSRSDRSDISRLEDLAGRSVVSPSQESLGGNLMQLWEMHRQGIVAPKVTYLGMPHDLSVQAVMDRSADAAFVRTGVLEAMAREGKLKLSDIKIINQRPRDDYPQILSTALYPEWPFCSASKAPEALVKAVTLALLSMGPEDPATKAAGFYGFSPPGDYSSVEAVMLRLRVHPGRMDEFDLRDVIGKYATVLVGALSLLLLVAAAAAAYLVVVNRASALSLKQRDEAQLALNNSVRALEETNAELEQFAYVATHDLRQPVRAVINYLSLIEKRLGTTIDEDLKKYLGFAKTGARRIDSLIVDLQEYSRAGRKAEPFVPTPLGTAVAESLHNLAPAIVHAGAKVTFADDMPTVHGCPSDLTRLMQNLIGNAVKYRHSERRPEINIGWRDETDHWLVWVQDNGIGIPPEFHDRVFGIFQRLVPREAFEGTGIGLTICRKVIEAHGGKIWIEDAVEGGCIFMMTFPKSGGAGTT